MSINRFQYQSLKDYEIRILILSPGKYEDIVSCRLDHVSLMANSKYETISYTWGDSNVTSTIQCDGGKMVEVTSNLESALRHLRYEKQERVLWADAICINQGDFEERSKQVQLMGEIYAHSQRVIVWLGEETEDVRTAFDQFRQLNAFFEKNEPDYPNDIGRWKTFPKVGNAMYGILRETEADWKIPIASLLSRSWFVRRWIIQEIAKSPEAVVVCGAKHIDWQIMAEVIWSLYKSGLLLDFNAVEDPWAVVDGIQGVLMLELFHRDLIQDKGSPLLGSIIATRRCKCLDPRDVIFSLFGLACDVGTFNAKQPDIESSLYHDIHHRLGVKPDYSLSVDETYHYFVLSSIINKQSLLPLSAPYLPPDKPMLDLPSWVPDFSALSNANPLMFLRNESGLPYRASGDSTVQARFSDSYRVLHVKGRQIDTIKAVTQPHDDTKLPAEVQSQATAENWTKDQLSSLTLQTWIVNSLKVLEYKPGAPETLFGLTSERFLEFSRTMLCDLTVSGDRTKPDIATSMLQWLETVTDSKAAIAKYTKDGNQEEFVSQLLNMDAAIGLRLLGWGFCFTYGRRMGRILANVKPGDKVVLLYGGEVPYILRPRDRGGWTFITSGYIHGLMDGEGMDCDEPLDQEFSIY